ncbi:hypothetical protein TRIATDRAFT_258660 [Trichoderma atroviride IMI 206040]|uniref:Uncharacterized protein n=1 Tax=Hypocrea atroviridis (strain ATCC 20476 / IMI 206040) TaxID=452589 RepID=G9P2T8_HYPAI|nr:uncharacterized protein TRIATDRAFT_258660 [Trichoderma atroviride IMI 206040]EHK43552.1 hypothetical protein TRIATDRAFT_258660 [Trichoderma atroviride IMI 206040]
MLLYPTQDSPSHMPTDLLPSASATAFEANLMRQGDGRRCRAGLTRLSRSTARLF